jgi:hypothetical protein
MYADTALQESPRSQPRIASIRSNREVALVHALTVTRGHDGRAVFDVSAIFLEFLDAAKSLESQLARRVALARAVDCRPNRTGGIAAAEAIVTAATAFLSIIETTETSQ